MGKSWDTKKVNDFIEYLEHAAYNYMDCLGDVHQCYEDYINNETFVGQAADSTKTFIALKQKKFNQQQYYLSKEMVKRYNDLDETFKAIVDPAADAKINTDVVSNVKTHFMNQYDYLERIGCGVQQKTIEAVDRLGKYGCDLEEINFKNTLMQYYDHCGTGGFLDNCIKKVEEFDDTASTRVFNSGIKNAIQEHIEEVTDTSAGLDMIHTQAVDINKQTLSLVSLSTGVINACTNTVSNAAINQYSPTVSPEIKMLMDEYGFTEEEAKLINKAINSLDKSCAYLTDDPYKRVVYIYGTMTTLCVSYDATRWRLTTGQPTLDTAIYRLKDAGLTDQEIYDLQVIINLQHDSNKEDMDEKDVKVENSTFSNETTQSMSKRAKEKNDFAHSTIQLTAFAHGDEFYINGDGDFFRLPIDYFNSARDYDFPSYTLTRYEISFKGDIDSGRWSESDFTSDIDSINIYERMMNDGDISLDAWASYYKDVDADSKCRSAEFFRNMGDGDEQIGIISTKKIIEARSLGSSYIQQTASKDVGYSKDVFMQWILSNYEGVEYDFPEE